MSPAEQLRVVILAAGASSRLGRDKATAPWGKVRLIQHILSQFPANRVGELVVVANPANAGDLRAIVSDRVQVVVNPEPGAEMISSVRVGLAALSATEGPACIHPVDVFALTPGIVAMLHDAWLAEPEKIHLPVVGERGAHPLLLPPRVASEVSDLPAGCGLNVIVHRHSDEVVRHPWPDETLLADIDSPEDYARYAPED